LLGATNELLGDFFGVARRTIQNWIAAHADFADGCAGRSVVDASVVRARFERARVYSHKVFRTMLYRARSRRSPTRFPIRPTPTSARYAASPGQNGHFRSLWRPKIRSTALSLFKAPLDD
jgi:hypothetical protein